MATDNTGNGRPDLSELYNHVVPYVATKWEHLGVQLLDTDRQHVLSVIEANHPQNVEERCRRVLKKWLDTKAEGASWNQLIQALESIQLNHVASKVKELLAKEGQERVKNPKQATTSITSTQRITKITNFDKIEVEFAKMLIRIKEALHRNKICVDELIEQLSVISAVKSKKVPLFDEDVFAKITSISELWRKLRKFWSIFDYDLLLLIIDLTECAEAKEILDNFLLKIDPSALEDAGLVLQHKVYDEEDLLQPRLRIKVNTDHFTKDIHERVKDMLSKKFDLEKYSLRLVGIKNGCVELLFYISKATKLYLLKCNISKGIIADFASLNVVSMQINDMKLNFSANNMTTWTKDTKKGAKSGNEHENTNTKKFKFVGKKKKTFMQYTTKGSYMVLNGSLFSIFMIFFVLFVHPKNNFEFCMDVSYTDTVSSNNIVSEKQTNAHRNYSSNQVEKESSYELNGTDVTWESVKETEQTESAISFESDIILSKPWLNDDGDQITPVVRVASNYTKMVECNKEHVAVGDPFLACEGGYQMVFSICPSGCNCGAGTHLSLYMHLMKGPYDDELEQAGRLPLSGLFRFELLNQFSDECHHVVQFASDEMVRNKFTNRVEVDGQVAHRYGIDEFIPLSNLNNTIYLQNDSLYFRITYKQYLSDHFMMHIISEALLMLKLNAYNSLFVFVLLIFIEYVLFCIEEITITPTVINHNFGISSTKRFLLAKKHVLLHTGFTVLRRGLRNFLSWIAMVASCLMVIVILEMMHFNLKTTLVMDSILARVECTVMWSWTIEIYTISWGRNIPMFGPMWIIHLNKFNFLKVCKFIYIELWSVCLAVYISSVFLNIMFRLIKRFHL